MLARKHPRIRTEGRPKLEDHIPIEVPFIINVDPSDKCPLKCRFCPTGDHELMHATEGRDHGPMSYPLFCKIVNDICAFPRPIKVLRLYKDGEPLANPNFVSMVQYAKESGCCDVIDTTTNALLLSPKKGTELVEAGLDRINISIYGMNTGQYENFCGRNVNFDMVVENVRHMYKVSRNRHGGGPRCVVNVKINRDVLPPQSVEEDLEKFYKTFGNICDEISDEHVMSCWPEFDIEGHGVKVNKLVNIYNGPLVNRLVCPYIFYSFSINSDGTASTCFLDWERKLVIGDTKTEKVADIWNGTKMRIHQLLMLEGRRDEHPTCRNCGQMTHGQPDDLDPYRQQLLHGLMQLA